MNRGWQPTFPAAGIADLRREPLPALLESAWRAARARFGDTLLAAAPGTKAYRVEGVCNHRGRFPAVSVTGSACSLLCDHCGGKILEGMVAAPDPPGFAAYVRELAAGGGRGLLVSGGCRPDGAVPLEPYLDGMAVAAGLGLEVIVHTGLVTREMARGLKAAGVHQVLLDLIGSVETIRAVYHLDRDPDDYRRSLAVLMAEGLNVVPHIVAGLHYGEVRGEYEALGWVADLRPAGLVLVALNPLPGTAMVGLPSVEPEEVGRLAAVARLSCPELPVSLGCARPPGQRGRSIERLAIDAGVTAVAFPSTEALAHARARGLSIVGHASCCSLGR